MAQSSLKESGFNRDATGRDLLDFLVILAS